ncbi:MAG TPA: nicotinate-nucleotide--dimethylbenzimidazole phosphoribosyltransferase [Parvibaculum sp.]|jgi:nicotinate-nucleotide--dimethylbenzimidazole phosphoribosyltransferase
MQDTLTLFNTFDEIHHALNHLPAPDEARIAAARTRQETLTKPPGSLGKLEDIACFLAGWQAEGPRADVIDVLIFAGNHGVTRQGISSFPAEVTQQMVANFEHGGAAINALADAYGLSLKVTALDLDRPTADFTQDDAMSQGEFLAAFNTGAQAVNEKADLIVLGEMGIGNTTAAAAIAAATFGGTGAEWAGSGTGLDKAGVIHKGAVIDRAIQRHTAKLKDPLAIMQSLGGRELAAIAGATLRARQLGIPVLLDGYIVTAAVAPLASLAPLALDHCIAGHVSHEQGHRRLLAALGLDPLLDLNMRLGEGSGAAIAAMVLRGAVASHRYMATFTEAQVSNSTS